MAEVTPAPATGSWLHVDVRTPVNHPSAEVTPAPATGSWLTFTRESAKRGGWSVGMLRSG